MPLPRPRKGEKKSEYAGRCNSFVHHENPNVDPAQANAMCYAEWDRRHKLVDYWSGLNDEELKSAHDLLHIRAENLNPANERVKWDDIAKDHLDVEEQAEARNLSFDNRGDALDAYFALVTEDVAEIEIAPNDYDPTKIQNDLDLSDHHRQIHAVWNAIQSGSKSDQWNENNIKLTHDNIVAEWNRRGHRHYWRSALDGTLETSLRDYDYSKCMRCSAPPTIQILWADGRAHAWFCNKHFSEFESEEERDIVARRRIPDGKVDINWPRETIRKHYKMQQWIPPIDARLSAYSSHNFIYGSNKIYDDGLTIKNALVEAASTRKEIPFELRCIGRNDWLREDGVSFLQFGEALYQLDKSPIQYAHVYVLHDVGTTDSIETIDKGTIKLLETEENSFKASFEGEKIKGEYTFKKVTKDKWSMTKTGSPVTLRVKHTSPFTWTEAADGLEITGEVLRPGVYTGIDGQTVEYPAEVIQEFSDTYLRSNIKRSHEDDDLEVGGFVKAVGKQDGVAVIRGLIYNEEMMEDVKLGRRDGFSGEQIVETFYDKDKGHFVAQSFKGKAVACIPLTTAANKGAKILTAHRVKLQDGRYINDGLIIDTNLQDPKSDKERYIAHFGQEAWDKLVEQYGEEEALKKAKEQLPPVGSRRRMGTPGTGGDDHRKDTQRKYGDRKLSSEADAIVAKLPSALITRLKEGKSFADYVAEVTPKPSLTDAIDLIDTGLKKYNDLAACVADGHSRSECETLMSRFSGPDKSKYPSLAGMTWEDLAGKVSAMQVAELEAEVGKIKEFNPEFAIPDTLTTHDAKMAFVKSLSAEYSKLADTKLGIKLQVGGQSDDKKREEEIMQDWFGVKSIDTLLQSFTGQKEDKK